MQNILNLTSEVRELIIGSSFRSAKTPEKWLNTIKYDFKPASIDINKQGIINVAQDKNVTITLPHSDGPSSSGLPTVFNGSIADYSNKECVLIINRKTNEIVLERLHKKVQVKKTREAPVNRKFNVVAQKPVHGSAIKAPDSGNSVAAKTNQEVSVQAASKPPASSKTKGNDSHSVKKPKKPAKSAYQVEFISKLPPTPCIRKTSSAPIPPNPYARVEVPEIIQHAPAKASTPLRKPPPKKENTAECSIQTAKNKSASPWNSMRSPAISTTWPAPIPPSDNDIPEDIAAAAFGWNTHTPSANLKKPNATPKIDMSKPRNRISVIPDATDQKRHQSKSAWETTAAPSMQSRSNFDDLEEEYFSQRSGVVASASISLLN